MLKYTLIGFLPTLVVVGLLFLFRDSIWPALFSYHAMCLCIPLVSRCYFKEAGLNFSNPKRWIPLTVLLSVLLLTTSVIGSRFINLVTLLPEGWEVLFSKIQPWRWFVIYSLLMNSILEEYFWRGFLLPQIGIVQGTGLFWLLHFVAIILFIDPLTAVILTLPVFVFGLLWAWMRQKLETLWPCFITHLFADIAILYSISHAMKLP